MRLAGLLLAVAIAGGAMPVQRLTPGAVATDDPDVICQRDYSSSQRLYTTDRARYWQLRREVFAAYGVPWAERDRYELDDRIPLCLGGAQVFANLWPQPRFGSADAEQKDRIEALACRAACAAHTLQAVDRWQNAFRGDWRAIAP